MILDDWISVSALRSATRFKTTNVLTASPHSVLLKRTSARYQWTSALLRGGMLLPSCCCNDCRDAAPSLLALINCAVEIAVPA
jgi:hypothetical protein